METLACGRPVIACHARDCLFIRRIYQQPSATSERARLTPVGISTSDYLGGVFSPGRESECIHELVQALIRELPRWHLELPNLKSDSPLLHFKSVPGLRIEKKLWGAAEQPTTRLDVIA